VRHAILLSLASCVSACGSSSTNLPASTDLDSSPEVASETSLPDGSDALVDTTEPSDSTDAPTDMPVDTAFPYEAFAVPLDVVTRNSGGGKGLAVNLVVGTTKPKAFLLDTGSAGVHVMADEVDPASIKRTGTAIKEIYVDGTELVGEEAMALVRFGDASRPPTKVPIAIHVIDKIDCVSGKPSCPAASVGNEFFRVHGQVGIVGVGMSNAIAAPSVFNPIAQMPGNFSTGFIVTAKPFGGTSGTLTLGLTTVNTAGFATTSLTEQSSKLPNGASAWEDAKVNVCYELDGTSSGCGPSIFDTGATATFWQHTIPLSSMSVGALAPGHSWRATIAGVLDWSFTVGSPSKPGLDMVIPSPGSFNTNLGIGVFFAFDVAFDLKKGTIGVR
jgi:hypothetical protein